MRIAVAGATGTIGRHLVMEAGEHGHEVVVIARHVGVDVRTGAGLTAALTNVDAVVDVLSIATLDATSATDFFVSTAHQLLAASAEAGVRHRVLLSIVGVDRNPHGYYAGKLAQERVYEAAADTTILRATQFHEFAAQMYDRARVGPIRLAPQARVQPVAAREVAEALIGITENAPSGRERDLAGPREEELSAMVRAYAARIGARRPPALALPGAQMAGMRAGAQLPGPEALRGTQTFAEWLEALPLS